MAELKVETLSAGLMREKTNKLFSDIDFLVRAAEAGNEAYYKSICKETIPLFDNEQKELLLEYGYGNAPDEVKKDIVKCLAGFMATQEAVFAIAKKDGLEPIKVLELLASGSKYVEEASRFAHLSWAMLALAMKPEIPENLMTFDSLNAQELNKDAYQVRFAAELWHKELTK